MENPEPVESSKPAELTAASDLSTDSPTPLKVQPQEPHEADGAKEFAFDNVAKPAFEKLDPRQITVSRIASFIFSGFVCLGVFVGIVITFFVFWFHWIWYLIAGIGFVFILFMLWIAYVWPAWEYDKTSWRLSENGLEIRRGVFWQHRISIPVARVQHADVSQGPLQRNFELGKLTVHTAGTQNASIDLEGISHAKAIELRDLIVNQRKSADVV